MAAMAPGAAVVGTVGLLLRRAALRRACDERGARHRMAAGRRSGQEGWAALVAAATHGHDGRTASLAAALDGTGWSTDDVIRVAVHAREGE